MKRTHLIAAAGVLIASAIAFWVYRSYSNNSHTLVLPGIVEIQEVRLASKVGGRVAKLHVHEGATVAAGDPLVTFDVPELEKQYAQQQARVAQLWQEWKKAENGPREEEIDAAKAESGAAKARFDRVEVGFRAEERLQSKSDMESAQADYKYAEEEYLRISRLHANGSASRAEFEAARMGRDRTFGRFNSAKAVFDMMEAGSRIEDKLAARYAWEQAEAKLKLLLAGTRVEDKHLAKARYDEADAKLEEMKVNLSEKTIYAPELAFVEVIAVRPGDVVPPNQPVIRVLRAQDIWIKAYVPATKVSMLPDGAKVEIRVDAYPDAVFEGKVLQVGTISEFTPRNVQSIDERRYQVFPVKVRVMNGAVDVFRAGLAAEITIPLEKNPWRK